MAEGRRRFETLPGHPRLRNIVGTIPGRAPAIVLGAHYDSENHPRGFVGANDWGIARTLYRLEGFNGYGYHFWTMRGEKRRFVMRGVYGQAIYVDPEP